MPDQHVVPNPEGGWGVRPAGGSRLTPTETQSEAISIARERSQNQGTELFIHGRDGRIRARDSHGNDPHPPKN
jgi:hypothetical protein